MDAAHTLLKKTVFLLPLALFAIAPVVQAQPSFVPITSPQTILFTGGLNVAVNGSSDPSAPITFTASIDSVDVPPGGPQGIGPGAWLTLAVTGTTPGFVVITPSNVGTGSGTFTAVVRLHATAPAGVADTTFTASFNNTGSGGGQTGSIMATPASLPLSAIAGNTASTQVTLSTASTDAIDFTVGFDQPWLNQSSASALTVSSANNVTLTVIASAASLVNNTYTGNVIVTPTVGTATIIPVTFTVGGGGGTGALTAAPNPVSISFTSGSGVFPGSQVVTLTSTGGATTFTAVVNSSNGWLQANAQTAIASGNFADGLTVSVNGTALSALTTGTTGTIQVTDSLGETVTVQVNLTLTTPPLTVSATPTSLTLTYRAGDPPPASQPVSVTGGGASLSFTATASSSGNWLVVSPGSGTTPATLTVSLSAANLAKLNASPTPYIGTITVSGSGSAIGSTTITVSLTVAAPLPTVNGLTNAGSFLTGSISPGEIITLFGIGIGPATQAVLALDATGKVSTTIGGVQVLVNGFACPMIFASATQISAVVPYELAGFTTADVLVKFLSQTSNAVHVNVGTTAPGLFTQNASGKGPGAILNRDNSFNSPNTPAAKGDIVAVYLTGEGQTNPKGVTGKVTTVSATLPLTPAPLLLVSVLIGPPGAQQSANFTFAGEAPGLVSGAMQLNVQIPATAASGDQPIVVSIGGNPSQPGVTVSVK